MAWVRIDDQAPRNRKLRRAGAAAAWLWVCGLAHCQSQLTDGFIDEKDLDALGFNGRVASASRRLTDAGLWELVTGGFRVHDYLEFNEDRATVLARRQTEQARKRKERQNGGFAKAVRADGARTAPGRAGGQPLDVRAPSSAPIPSHPILPSSTEQKTEAAMTTTKTPPTTARSKRPIFSGQRITVFEWMLDELMKMLGPLANDFDLDEWFWTADALAMKETVVATDWWAWLKHATVEEARRRGLPIASNPALMGKQTTRLAMAVANIKAREAAERDAR